MGKRIPRQLRILITTGPTREYIDPVRYITNASTGAVGFALARAAQQRGHRVILLSGPTYLKPPVGIKCLSFISAAELQRLAGKYAPQADGIICAAAVGDFRPQAVSRNKIKKKGGARILRLVPNPDVLAGLGRDKQSGQVLVGFALETNDLVKNALSKLNQKNLDIIVANQLSAKQLPFGDVRTNVKIINRKTIINYNNITKQVLAGIILDSLEQECYNYNHKKGGKP